MKISSLVALLALVAFGSAGLGDEPKKNASAADQLKALRKEVDEAHAAYLRAVKSSKKGDPPDRLDGPLKAYTKMEDENNPKILDLVRNDPKAKASLEALEWIITESNRNAYQPYAKEVAELLRDHHAKNSKVGRLCAFLSQQWASEPTLEFLKQTSAKNPDRMARGQATLTLGRLLNAKAQSGQATDQEQRERDFQEVERLFETVIKKYGDCPNLGLHKATLREEAEPELLEIRYLRVGKKAPDIKGLDLDGKPFKLSDYRGKVVVLDFWGNW
jgi:hypothetical protein